MLSEVPVIHVVDDDESLRRAVSRLLDAGGYEVKTYATAAEFLGATIENRLGCIVLDVRMPGTSGFELHSALARRQCQLPILFLTGHGDIPMSVQAMKAGAVNFLTKPVAKADLLAAVSNAVEIHQRTLVLNQHKEEIKKRWIQLNDREAQVFEMVVAGRLNKQIAASMGIAERTVKGYRAQVMQKMGAESLAELVRMADQLKIT